jgi:hypothetical protein
MTYLEIVNRVLRRLRETEVSTVNENVYSKLIGDLVNSIKSEVENTYNWSVLRQTLTATTSNNLFNYILDGAGTRFKVIDVINDTSNWFMNERSLTWFNTQFLIPTTPQTGSPRYYNFNGVDANGDTQVDVFPIPDGNYELRFNVVLPQAELVNDTDVIQVNGQLVVEGTLARAISERGEDGGNQDVEARYRNMLADLIAIEANNRPDEITWYYK